MPLTAHSFLIRVCSRGRVETYTHTHTSNIDARVLFSHTQFPNN